MFFAHGSNPSSSEEKISSASAHPGTNDRRTTATRIHHLNRMKKDIFCFNHWLKRKEVANKRAFYMCQGLRPNRYHQQQHQQQSQCRRHRRHRRHHHHHHHLSSQEKTQLPANFSIHSFYQHHMDAMGAVNILKKVDWVSGVITVVVIHLSRKVIAVDRNLATETCEALRS